MSKTRSPRAAPATPAASAAPAAPAAPAALELPDWNAFSPTRLWRDWIVKSEAQWSETLSQLLKDERVGDSLNRQLSEMQLAHRQLSEWAQASLAAANLPSRSDIEALDERMGRLEDGMAHLAAAVSQLARALMQQPDAARVSPKAPARDRKPGKTAKPADPVKAAG